MRKPVKRYSPPEFHSSFVLTSTNNEPNSVGAEFDLAEGKLWKDDMVEEMESLHKNETWDLINYLVEENLSVENGYSRRI